MIDLTAPDVVEAIIEQLRPAERYRGMEREGMAVVLSDHRTIDPQVSLRVRNHSPNGFAWGYQGSGSAQLALALLLDAGLPVQVAADLYQRLKQDLVSQWTVSHPWEIEGHDLQYWIESQLALERERQLRRRYDEEEIP